MELLSLLDLRLQQAWFKQPTGGWPDPIRIPRPGEEPEAKGPTRLDTPAGAAAMATVFGQRVHVTTDDDGHGDDDRPRHRPRMRDRTAPDGAYRRNGDG